jgi:formate/nitrite transporter FocA (FNT family)
VLEARAAAADAGAATRQDGPFVASALAVDEDDDKKSEERQRLRSPVVYEIVRREGEEELNRPLNSLWWSGVAAGAAISSSLLTKALLHHYLPDAPWRPVVESFGYCVGFLIVILGRMELFTEHTVSAVLPLLKDLSVRNLLRTGRLWIFVLGANLAGTAAAAVASVFIGTAHPDHLNAMLEVSREFAALPPLQALVYGIPAGFLVAAIVWMLPSAQGSEFWIIVTVTYVIGLAGFTHVVVGSAEIFVLVLHGELGLAGSLRSLGPTLLGNIIGGTGLFAVLAYGQVREEV